MGEEWERNVVKGGEAMADRMVPLAAGRPGARTSLATVTAICASAMFLVQFATTFPNTALPVMLRQLHLPVSVGGFGVTLFFIASSLMFFLAGTIMDRWSRKDTFLLILAATAVFSALLAGVRTEWQWLAARFLMGVSFAMIGTVPVLLAEYAPARLRGLLIGIPNGAFGLGAVVASLVSSYFLPRGEWRILFLLPFVPTAALLAVAWATLRDPARFEVVARVKHASNELSEDSNVTKLVDIEKARRFEWRQLFAADLRRQSTVLSIASFLIGFGTNALIAFSVLFLTLYDHLNVGVAALALSAESLATMVGQFGSGWLADYFSARNVVAIFSVLGGLSICLLAVRGNLAWVLVPMIGGGLFGQGLLGCLPRYAADSFPTRVRGSGTALVTGSHFFAPVFTGTFYGFILQAHQLILLPIVGGAITVAAGVVLLAGKNIPPRQELEDIAI
jgi:MFS family permease